MTSLDEALRALVNTIIRDCCESETSDPERDDTIMIREGTLREILERVLLTTRQEVAPVAIDDDKLLELLRKHFLKSGHRNRDAYEAMTYEKSPEMFPQATYDVPTCAVTAFVQDCVAAFASTGQTSDARDALLIAGGMLRAAMEMQEGRELETLHISQPTAKFLWDSAKQAWDDAAMQATGGGE